MSFYTYYGKQGNDLFVAVLPNGTIEHGDPIYLYTKDQFTSHRAKTVIVSADGEDVVSFGNELFQYQATSKKGYRELGLTLKHTSKSFDISLTRLYDLPLSVVPVTDEPKIWTGIFNFHEWANTESIIVIAPKGLGNDKPIVCLWQWTKDNKGVKNTLSTSHAKQISAASNASSFSFKQGDYYTLECNVNATTKGLDVEVKSSSNSSSNLTLKLSAEVKLGSDHNFSPPRPVQKKLELDCSRPQTTPALPRMTGLLPFPGNLVDTLTYSAAFVDQAGYLAKHAVKQFNQLEKSFQQLEIKSEARGARIIVLEGQLNEANEKNTLLTNENRLLKEQLAAAAELAKKQLAELQKKLDDSLAREKDLKRLNKSLVAENAKLRAHIDADELADLLREQEWLDREREHAEHDAQDLARQLQLEADLRKANQTIQDLRKKLQDKEREIGQLEAKLEFKNGQLKAAEAIIAKLRVDLKKERADRARVEADLRRKLQEEERQREILQAKLAEANNKIVDLECKVESQKGELEMLKAALQAADIKIVDLECKIESQNGVIDRLTAELKESRDAHEVTKAALHKTEATLKETEETLTKEREEREQEVANLKSKHAAEKKELVAKHERDIAAEKKKVTAKEAEKSAALDLVARTNELLKAKEVERDDMEKASSEKEEEHKKEIEDLEKKQREEIADLQRKHDKKIAELETKHKKIVDDLKPRVLDATTKKDTVIVSSTEIVN